VASYDAFLATFEEKRRVFLWSTPEFRARLALVLADLFPTDAEERARNIRIAERRAGTSVL